MVAIQFALEDAIEAHRASEETWSSRLTPQKVASCAHCLGHAADFLEQALQAEQSTARKMLVGAFEQTLQEAEQMYGLSRSETLGLLNEQRDHFGIEVTEENIAAIADPHLVM